MNALIPTVNPVTMTSLEISELTGSRHDSVKRAIETLSGKGVITSPPRVEKPTDGRPVVEYVFSGEQGYYNRIHYDPSTGAFTWAVSAPGITVGKPAGTVSVYGYRVIRLARKSIRACRLAWFLSHGSWPEGEIDHINGDRLDDRLENIRVVDRAGNSQNKGSAQANNRSCGLLGVTWNKQHQRWQSKIMANKMRHHVGYFDTPEEAHAAYMAAKARLHIGGRSH